MKTTAITPAAKADLVPADAAADLAMYAGEGLEHVTAADVLIPRISILQALSPQVQKGGPAYIAGAGVGDMADVSTGELINPPLIFIPVRYSMQWLEWAPRSVGGLVAIHDTPAILQQCEKDSRNRYVLPSGNYIAQTANFYGLNLSLGCRRSFISMSSTQLKKARRWLSLATFERLEAPDGRTFTPPLYYRTYMLTTVQESNAQGQWMGWKIERGEPITALPSYKTLLAECRDFARVLAQGSVKADLAEAEHTDIEDTL
jgi:hypothetical protein